MTVAIPIALICGSVLARAARSEATVADLAFGSSFQRFVERESLNFKTFSKLSVIVSATLAASASASPAGPETIKLMSSA